jgi:CTP:molybdopterin cytidylyltransferase MocA
MTRPATAALILAGGLSSRLEPRFKPLLPLAGRTPLTWLAETFRAAGVTDITVVVGHRADETASEVARLGLYTVFNPHYKTGMYSSVKAGLAVLPPGIDRFFLTPVDVPLFRPATLGRLLDRAGEPDAPPTLYPTFAGERGHPPLLSTAVIPAAMGYDGERGLRCALENFAFAEVPVADAAILADMDTPEDYLALAGLAERLGIPSVAEAEALLALEGTPQGGLAHARGVAAVAVALGRALLASGLALDMELLESAALLHDVAKPRARHEAEGGRMLTELGFTRAAPIVAAHRDVSLADDAPLTEREIVFLADKFVFGRWLVPVPERFQQKLDLYADEPEATAAIRRRLANALGVLARVEARIGKAEAVIDAAGFRPGPPPAEAYESFRRRFLANRQKRQAQPAPVE